MEKSKVINNPMKKLSDILFEAHVIVEEIGNSNTIVPPITPETTDRVGTALQKLDQIGEMVDDLYNTLSHLEEIDAETDAALTGAYNTVDDLYAKIDEKYDVIPVDLEDEDIEEAVELEEAEEKLPPVPKKLKELGFVAAPVGHNTWKPSNHNVIALYGIPMRAGKWADVFYAVTDDKKPYTVIDDEGVTAFANERDAMRALVGLNEDVSELTEVLSKDAPASEWIDDFVKSDAPQFKGKSKKERIKMALGAYYGAQKKEDLDEAVDKKKIKDKIDALKKSYSDIVSKKNSKHYTDEYDAQSRIFHDRRLKEIPKEISKLRNKLLGEDLDEAAASDQKWKIQYSYADPSGKGIANGAFKVSAKDAATAKRYAESDLAKRSLKNVKVNRVTAIKEDLDEAGMSPQQRADAQRVQYGAMKQDEYNKKYKLGKYRPAGNKLAGPGGLYKNLLHKSVREDNELEEGANTSKIKELVAMSRIGEKDVEPTIAALKATQSDKELTPNQIKLLSNLAVNMANAILGDPTALSSVKKASKE